MKNDTVLKVQNVSKSFRLPTEQANGVKQAFINWTKGVKGYKEQRVLKGINLEVKKGDFFGIVGRNGSGKSTLLKIISQIYTPEKGTVEVKGKLVPFIELGVGFNPELTGRENVYMNGALLGFSKEEISEMYDDIVEFSELENFMDQKLKNYSSGMQVRLAFSVAIKAQGDILVLDEVLAVGDAAFQRKCDNFFSEVKKDKTKTVILVTHSMDSVQRYCNKAVMIEDGKIVADNKDDAVNRYIELNLERKSSDKSGYALGLNDKLDLFSINGENIIKDDDLKFNINYNYNGKEKSFMVFIMYDITRGGIVLNSHKIKMKKGKNKVHVNIPIDILNNGSYKVAASVYSEEVSGDEGLIGYTNDVNSYSFVYQNPSNLDNYSLLDNNMIKMKVN
jgi:ABC transporter related